MAKTRLITTNLLRMLDQLATPVYLVESNIRITYANKACLEWLGIEATDLGGLQCRYSSEAPAASASDTPPPADLNGLAPPPSLWTAGIESVEFEIHANLKQATVFRNANAIPLKDESKQVAAILITCGLEVFETSPNDSPDATEPDDERRLHEILADIRSRNQQIYNLPSVLGLSSTNQALRKKIDAAIASKSDLLICGPHGSGREHLARAIDIARRPNGKPIVPIHCEIADPELIQKNLQEAKSNRLAHEQEPQDEALLLLDVDQLSEVAQAELVGFMQLPGFSSQVIATSSQSLESLAGQQEFNPKLAQMLSTISIELLRLKERAGDIPILAQMFLEEMNLKRNKQLGGFSAAAIQLLQQFEWPQNIDELQREVIAAAQSAKGNKVVLEDLSERLRQAARANEIGGHQQTQIELDEYLQRIESQLIARAMKHSKGNKTLAAKLLGISRPKLLRRLQLLESQIATASPPKVESDYESPASSQMIDSSAFKEALEEADDE